MDADTAFATRVESVFREIAATRMAGIPIVNTRLGVAMRGARRHGAHIVGVLVTPWFMNIMFFPLEQDEAPRRVGSKTDIMLPAGCFEAIWNFEDALGGYWSSSLFSPMFEFEEMEVAIETADATLDLLFTPPEEPDSEDFRADTVNPGLGRDVETRLAEAEARAKAEAEAREAAALAEAETESQVETGESNDKPSEVSRRQLFGFARKPEDTDA